MVRRKVEIKAIEDNSKRYTAFTKRRCGLFNKANKLCDLTHAQAAVLIFSKAGNAFGFGHPHLNQVINRYLADPTSANNNSDADNGVEGSDGGGLAEEQATPPPPLTEAETRIHEAMANAKPTWDVMVGNLGLRQLDELEKAMEEVKSMVAERVSAVAAGDC